MSLRNAVAVIFVLATFGLGARELTDVDLGWHLAGGLWSLRNLSFPSGDPFTIGAAYWVNYSWLPQVIIALTYRAAGFWGLFCLQLALVLITVGLLARLATESTKGLNSQVLALVLGLILVAPSWHLRPQLLSVIFLTIALLLCRRQGFRLHWAIPLGVVWVNSHVFWPLLAVLGALESSRKTIDRARDTLVVMALGVLNPYGWRMYDVLWRYATNHSEAYSLITEFQPLDLRHELVLLVFVLTAVLAARYHRDLLKQPSYEVWLFIILAAAAQSQVKYVPLFGVVTTAVFSRFMLGGPTNDQKVRVTPGIIVGLLFLACLTISFIKWRPVAAERRELLELVKPLPDGVDLKIFNHFDDGGWLELGLLLAGKERARVWIDGRTLVMGESRLREFRNFRRDARYGCELLRSLAPEFIANRKDDQLIHERIKGCNLQGKVYSTTALYELWKIDHG